MCYTNRCGTEKECKSQPPKQICEIKTAKECRETPASTITVSSGQNPASRAGINSFEETPESSVTYSSGNSPASRAGTYSSGFKGYKGDWAKSKSWIPAFSTYTYSPGHKKGYSWKSKGGNGGWTKSKSWTHKGIYKREVELPGETSFCPMIAPLSEEICNNR